ncbi:MAG: haloacid dehalogenase-like hydrolase [Alphaproteobacteria bacterium]
MTLLPLTAPAITPSGPIKLGLDFDNTIVCYDAAIALLAEELFDLPPEVPRTKLGLRDHLRGAGREPEWTAFQGELYGPGMRHAQPFEGAIETMLQLVAAGHELVIVSHRSRRPYAGEPHDLHAAARGWVAERLQSTGLFSADSCSVNFLETRQEKVARIAELGCQAFLDDLPEVLADPGFPASAEGILFDPSGGSVTLDGHRRISAWADLSELLES